MKRSLTSTILYILSIVLLLVGSVQLFQATNYIIESVNQQYVSWIQDFTTIISYISQACTNTYCFAILFYVLAKMYNMLKEKSDH